MTKRNRGFILLIVLASMAVVILSGVALINIGTNEMVQVKRDTDQMNAYYGAVSGAERLYAFLTSQLNQNISWASQISSGSVVAGESTLATYSAFADSISYDSATKKGELGIVSTGVSGGATSRITVKYDYTATSVGPPPVSSFGNIVLTGHTDGDLHKPKSSSIYIEGPLQAGPDSAVSKTDPAGLVEVIGGSENDVDGISKLSFWLPDRSKFDTTDTHTVFSDATTVTVDGVSSTVHTGYVTEAMAIAQAGTADKTNPTLATFYANDVNGDLVINDKDAFIYYYTVYLDQATETDDAAHLNIGPGETNYFSPTSTPDSFKDPRTGLPVKLLEAEDSLVLKKREVARGTEIIFVDGDLYINKTDIKWKNGAFTHTIVCTGDVAINQPTNGKDDTLAIVALGNVSICGKDTGKSQLNGNFIVYTAGNFTALRGGTSHNAIFAEGTVTIDTLTADKKYDRTMYGLLGSWSSPIGLPPGYRTIAYKFALNALVKPQWDMTGN
jgi:hypothetical protein